MRGHASVLRLPFAVLVLCACDPDGGPRADAWSFHNALFAAGRFEIVAPEGALFARGERLAEFLERHTGFAAEVRERSDDGGDEGAVRIVLGLFDDPEVARLARQVGAVPEGGGFRVLERLHSESADALIAVFADPDRDGLPLVLFAGNDAEALALRVVLVPAPWVPHLWTFRGDGPGLDVPLAPGGALDADGASRGWIDRSREREELRAELSVEADDLVLHRGPGVDEERWTEYLFACEGSLARVREWFGAAALSEPIHVHVHSHVEDFARVTGKVALSVVDPATLRVDALLQAGVPSDDGAAVARAATTRLLGPARDAWLADGIGVAAAGRYWGRELSDWIGLLREAEALPRAADVVRPEARSRTSEHAVVPTRGRLVLASLEEDPAAFARAWCGEELFRPGRPPRGRVPAEVREERRVRRAAAAVPGRRGVALHEGFGPSSIGTRRAAEALAAARTLGADAFSVTVLAGTQARVPVLAVDDGVFGSVADVALASTLVAGARLDMSAVLVVEPMLTPSGSRIDAADMMDGGEIERVFDEFERTALHYALLAELVHADVLCLGAGMSRASATVPRDGDGAGLARAKSQRLAAWRRVLGRARAVFGGALTYAAHLRYEAEEVAFWPDLDLVGLIEFGRIAWRETLLQDGIPIDAAIGGSLVTSLRDANELAARTGRPALFLQIGFPARSGSFADPLVPSGEASEHAQERYYAALERVVSSWPNDQDPVGLLVWSWTADAERAAPAGYSPRGLAAEAHLERIFRRR